MFKHPSTKTGTVQTKKTLEKNYVNNPFLFGDIGIRTTVTVSNEADDIELGYEAYVTQYDQNTLIITLPLNNKVISNIDHCLVYRIDCFKRRILIDRIHVFNVDNNILRYVHNITGDDVGTVRYAFKIIHNSYITTDNIMTNEIIVE